MQPSDELPIYAQPVLSTAQKKRGKGPNKEGLSYTTTYLLSGISACTAESVVYPCDMIKTRLQIMHKSGRMFETGSYIIRNEGITGLYMGFQVACYRHLIYSGCRYLAYELLRENVFHRNEDGSFPLWKSALAAMSSGAIGQFIASPTDLVKVQMQTEGFRVIQGEKMLYNGTFHCFKSMYAQMCFFGMWKGWFPNVQRAAFVQLGDLTAYDMSKQALLKYTPLEDNFVCHGCASICAGLVATIMSTPSDVLKTRIMSNPQLYKGTWDCAVKTVSEYGILSLYRGFFPIWARMGPKAMVFYLTFEQLRCAIGLPSW